MGSSRDINKDAKVCCHFLPLYRNGIKISRLSLHKPLQKQKVSGCMAVTPIAGSVLWICIILEVVGNNQPEIRGTLSPQISRKQHPVSNNGCFDEKLHQSICLSQVSKTRMSNIWILTGLISFISFFWLSTMCFIPHGISVLVMREAGTQAGSLDYSIKWAGWPQKEGWSN